MSSSEEERLVSGREAYKSRDVARSKTAHTTFNLEAAENHNAEAGAYLKSIVYGGLDGIITTFAIVSGVAGAGLSTGIVIIMGFANLIADAISMGMGDYLSTVAEQDYAQTERNREKWECENYLEGEQKEMIELWMAKGLSQEEAKTVIDILSRHTDLFVDLMMVEELGIFMEEEVAWKHGLVTFGSFVVFGLVPLIAYLLALIWDDAEDQAGFDVAFTIAGTMTGATLFLLGAAKTKLTGQVWWRSGLLTLFYGGLAAALAWAIGFVLAKTGLADESSDCSCSSG